VTDRAVILLAEDREDDIIIIRRAFQKGGIINPLFVVRDGEEAVAYLEGRGRYFSPHFESSLPIGQIPTVLVRIAEKL